MKYNNNYDRSIFYKNVLRLMLPLAAQNLINVGVSATDVLMLGTVGEKVLAGASLGGQVQFIMTLIFFGLSSGASVLIAQYWGKGDVPTIEKIMGISMKISVGVALAFTVATLVFPASIMGLMTGDGEVIEQGVIYLRTVGFSYLFMAVTTAYLNTLRSVECVTVSVVIYLTSLIANIIFNWVFIFGNLGAPALGVAGAAIGTLGARIIEFIMVIVYDRKYNSVFKFKLSFLRTGNRFLTKDYIGFSMPVVINELLWGSGVAVMTAILGHIGSSVTAANSVVQVVRQLAMVLAMGVANSTAIMLGKVIGEGKIDRARQYGERFRRLSIGVGLIGSVIVIIARFIILATMNFTDETKGYVSMMMFVMVYFVVCQAYNTDIIVGILRAGGDTKAGLLIDVGTLWCVALLFGAIAAFVWKASVTAVYVILLSDEVLKLPITTWRYKKRIWLKDVTRTAEELEENG